MFNGPLESDCRGSEVTENPKQLFLISVLSVPLWLREYVRMHHGCPLEHSLFNGPDDLYYVTADNIDIHRPACS